MNFSSDPQLRPELFELPLVCPNEDKNETSDDLYGPGRTVGKAFDFGGRHIDTFLSKTAERMGYGPRVTTQRIRRRREVIEHAFVHYEGVSCWRCDENAEEFLRSPASINAEVGKVKKDIERLLKYVNSNVQSTQRLAISHIVDLTRYDDIRNLLKGMGATKIISDSVEIYSKFRFGDTVDLLLSSSRKALVSLGDAEINTLLQEWITVVYSRILWVDPEEKFKSLWNRIAPYLNDPDTAFLVMRALRRTDLGYFNSSQKDALSSLRNSPKYFEWEEYEAAFHYVMEDCSSTPVDVLSPACDLVLQYADKMPGIFKSGVFQELSMNVNELDGYSFVDVHRLKTAFVRAVASAGDDGRIPSLDVLKSMYTCPALEPLLNSLVCPIERVLGRFVGKRRNFHNYTPGAAESHIYNEILRYIDSSDLTLRSKAWNYVNFFLAHDIYRCDMMLQALSLTHFAIVDDFSNFKKTKKEQCIPKKLKGDLKYPLYRHLDRNDNQIHLSRGSSHYCACEIVNDEEMTYPDELVLYMKVERGTTFYSAGLYPLVAGHDADGKCVYVARIWFRGPDRTKYDGWEYIVSTITDGAKPEDLRIEASYPHQKSLRIPEWFDVFVLRYALEAYPKALGAHGEGLDVTGPFSWRPAKEHEVYRKTCTARVTTADEARACEEMLNKDGYSLRSEGKVESNVEPDDLGLHSCDERDGAEPSSQPDTLGFLSCEGDKAISELETSESIPQMSDGICRPETDVHLQSCDGRMGTNLESGSDEFVGELELGAMVNALEENSRNEENKYEPNSPQSGKVDLYCRRPDQMESDSDFGELDCLLHNEIGYPGIGESDNAQHPTYDGGVKVGLASESNGPTLDETSEQVIASRVRDAGTKSIDRFRFIIPSIRSMILYAFMFIIGVILGPYIL